MVFFQASETVRTLLVYGYVLDPPTSSEQEDSELVASGCGGGVKQKPRTYRAEKTYGVTSGKW